MAKRKKMNKCLAIFCAIFFFIVGLGGGIILKIFLMDNYSIPQAEKASISVAQGSIDVEVVKNNDLSIHFLELGNKYTGDCTFIKVGDIEVLIDAGSKASSVTPIYEYVTKYIEDGVLEYVIVTHAHEDHYAGFATGEKVDSLFDLLNCKTVITFSQSTNPERKIYKNFVRELEETKSEKDTKVYTALECYKNENGANQTYDLGNDVALEILYHEYYDVKTSHSDNDYSVCCMLNQNNEKYYLFTGDLETDGEESLVNEYYKANGKDLPRVELYKAGHHGSKTSSSELLLSKIQPKIVCICCCVGSSQYTDTNANQFPTQQFIDRVSEWTDNVYATTLSIDYTKGSYESFNGTIVVSSNMGEDTKIACTNNNTKLKDTQWFSENRQCPTKWKKEA